MADSNQTPCTGLPAGIEYAVDTSRADPWTRAAGSGLRTLVRRRGLILELVRRDVADRYRGSLLGILWSFVHPLLLLATYTFVFSIVFRASWPGMEGRPLVFALMVFFGLVPFTMVGEVATKSCDSIRSAASYVKRVTFPLEVLPVVSVGSAAVHMLASLVVLAAGQLLVLRYIPWTVVFIPVLLIPWFLILIALGYLLACLGVFFRDLGHLVTVGLTLLMFLSPVLYPGSMVPDWAGFLLAYNPLAYVAEELRAVAVWGMVPSGASWARHTVSAAVILVAALTLFYFARRRFADVL